MEQNLVKELSANLAKEEVPLIENHNCNMEILTKIEEVKNHLIKHYGKPQTGTLNGRPYRYINTYLTNFERTLDNFLTICEQGGVDYNAHTNEILLLLEFLKDDNISSFCNFVKKVSSKNNPSKTLNTFFAEISEIGKYNYGKINQCCINMVLPKKLNGTYRAHHSNKYNPHYSVQKIEDLISIIDDNADR